MYGNFKLGMKGALFTVTLVPYGAIGIGPTLIVSVARSGALREVDFLQRDGLI